MPSRCRPWCIPSEQFGMAKVACWSMPVSSVSRCRWSVWGRERVKMFCAILIREAHRRHPHPLRSSLFEARHVTSGDVLPDHPARILVSAVAHTVASRRVSSNSTVLRAMASGSWDKRPTVVVQELDRVPVRRRDDRFACAQRIRWQFRETTCASWRYGVM